jgi:hypothetical protein
LDVFHAVDVSRTSPGRRANGGSALFLMIRLMVHHPTLLIEDYLARPQCPALAKHMNEEIAAQFCHPT